MSVRMNDERPLITTGNHRLAIRCPRCNETVTVGFTILGVLRQTVTYEAFLTAEVSAGGVSHRCEPLADREQPDAAQPHGREGRADG